MQRISPRYKSTYSWRDILRNIEFFGGRQLGLSVMKQACHSLIMQVFQMLSSMYF